MLKCSECEYFDKDAASGRVILKCDPFETAREPECLIKMQLMRIEALVQMQHATIRWHEKLSPMQEKMFKYMEREIDDIDESDKWKHDE